MSMSTQVISLSCSIIYLVSNITRICQFINLNTHIVMLWDRLFCPDWIMVMHFCMQPISSQQISTPSKLDGRALGTKLILCASKRHHATPYLNSLVFCERTFSFKYWMYLDVKRTSTSLSHLLFHALQPNTYRLSVLKCQRKALYVLQMKVPTALRTIYFNSHSKLSVVYGFLLQHVLYFCSMMLILCTVILIEILLSNSFLEILASTSGRGPLIIWKNFPSQIYSRTIFEMHTAPGTFLLYAPGAVYISNMVLAHIELRTFFKIINGPGAYGPGAYGPGAYGPGP